MAAMKRGMKNGENGIMRAAKEMAALAKSGERIEGGSGAAGSGAASTRVISGGEENGGISRKTLSAAWRNRRQHGISSSAAVKSETAYGESQLAAAAKAIMAKWRNRRGARNGVAASAAASVAWRQTNGVGGENGGIGGIAAKISMAKAAAPQHRISEKQLSGIAECAKSGSAAASAARHRRGKHLQIVKLS